MRCVFHPSTPPGLDRHLKDTFGLTHPLFRCEARREEAILQPAALQLSLVCDMFDSKAVMQQVREWYMAVHTRLCPKAVP